MAYNTKIEKIDYRNGFKVIHRVPDITEDEREKVKQQILLKLYNYYSRKIELEETKDRSKNENMVYTNGLPDNHIIAKEDDIKSIDTKIKKEL